MHYITQFQTNGIYFKEHFQCIRFKKVLHKNKFVISKMIFKVYYLKQVCMYVHVSKTFYLKLIYTDIQYIHAHTVRKRIYILL